MTPTDQPPLHGFQGDRRPRLGSPYPSAPCIAISREVGARGGSIARRIAEKLGWQVYDHELLEYLAQDPTSLAELTADATDDTNAWVQQRLDELAAQRILGADPTIAPLAHLILTLGARGEAVFVGRGAGYLLPRRSTLHARIVAPPADRVSFISQWLRLPMAEAEEQMRLRDARRAGFLATCFRIPEGAVLFDLVVNSGTFGEEASADLILSAFHHRLARFAGPPSGFEAEG